MSLPGIRKICAVLMAVLLGFAFSDGGVCCTAWWNMLYHARCTLP